MPSVAFQAAIGQANGMERDELERLATPAQLSAAVERYPELEQRLHGGHEQPGETVREVEYKGHRIRVFTTYRIEVDGLPVTGHLSVTNEGRVHYHAIPNEEFGSAVDMVKRIIDLSPQGLGRPDGGGHGPSHGKHDENPSSSRRP